MKQEQSIPHIITSLNATEITTLGQIFTQPSQTIPDQTLTMRQLIDRYAQGHSLEGGKEPIFEEDDEPTSGINPKTLDLVDIQNMKRANAENIDYLQTKDKNEKAAKKAAKQQIEEQKSSQP